MTIHVVIGPPCAGKSTFVAATATPGAPRFDYNLLASTLAGVDDLGHDYPPAVSEAMAAMRRGMTGWLLDGGNPKELWLIFTRPSDTLLTRLAGIGAEFHLIDPGIDECLARADTDGRPADTIAAIEAWYDAPPAIPDVPKGHDMTKILRAGIGALETKSAEDGTKTAEFEAYASVFNNVDSYGDVMVKGAFTRSLADWAAKDAPVPALWGHNMSDPDYNIGHVVKAEEDDHGLRVRVSIDLDSPKGKTVHRLLKTKRVREMSFAFWVQKSREGEQDGHYVRYVDDVDLIEVSVVPMGANPEAEVLAVKSAGGTPPGAPAVPVSSVEERLAKATADANAAAERLEKATAELDAARRSADDSGAGDPDPGDGEDGEDDDSDNPEEKSALDPALTDLLKTIFARPGATNS